MNKEKLADIQSIMERDPAARSVREVKSCYPGYKAIRAHRRANKLYRTGHYLLARMLSERSRRRTGIDIHPGATIGRGVFIDHGVGVVIGETAVVGDYVTIYQGVTLGGTGKIGGKRHPTLGDHVVVGAGAKVLGPFTIGDHTKIGAGAVVLSEVPSNCTVVGNPGRIVRRDGKKITQEYDLDHVNLPDPVVDHIRGLLRRVSNLERHGVGNLAQISAGTNENGDG